MDALVRPMRENDIEAADRIFRIAFGTFLGLPDPTQFMGDADLVAGRFRSPGSEAFVAEREGEVVGSNIVTHWGSVGFFGPLTVRPDLWNKGIAQKLLEPVLEQFAAWGTRHAGLFTFAQSPKHIALYQRYDFWPRYLTAVLARSVRDPKSPRGTGTNTFSAVAPDAREAVLQQCRAVTDAIYDGLDVRTEIESIAEHGLGDTVLLWTGSRLAGFAACHVGPRTEAGSGICYVKFGAIRPGPDAAAHYDQLIDACDALASSRQCTTLLAGANMARHAQYRAMLAHGFRTQILGVAMERGNQQGYNHQNVFVIDDWR